VKLKIQEVKSKFEEIEDFRKSMFEEIKDFRKSKFE
jgi:hypothetical protein